MTIMDGGRILFWLIVFSTSYNVDSKTLSEGIEAFETMKTLVLESIPKSIKSVEIFFKCGKICTQVIYFFQTLKMMG